jgi:hypothetical protein
LDARDGQTVPFAAISAWLVAVSATQHAEIAN